MPDQVATPTETRPAAEPKRAEQTAATHQPPVTDLSEHGGAYSYFRSVAHSSGSHAPPPEQFSPIFASADYANPVNDAQRGRVLGSMQQLYGNHYVQRMLSANGHATGKAAAQRQAAAPAMNGKGGHAAEARMHSAESDQAETQAGMAQGPIPDTAGEPLQREITRTPATFPPAPPVNGNGAHTPNGTSGGEVQSDTKPAGFHAAAAPGPPPMDGSGGSPEDAGTGALAREAPIQRDAADSPAVAPAAPALNGSAGHPLDSGTRASMEPLVGQDLSQVRVHTDGQAGQAAQNLNANAFTTGQDIYFAPGQYSPSSTTGLGLVAHELTHVAQQSQGTVSPGISQPGDAHELQAEAVQRAVTSGAAAPPPETPPTTPSVTPAIQRDDAGGEAPSGILGRVLHFLADKVNVIPGYRLFIVILGVNPIDMSRVDPSPANIMRAIVEVAPGGKLITDALDAYGVFDKVGNWVSQQLHTLGLAVGSIKQAIETFAGTLGLSDILLHPGDVWERAKRIFSEPVDRIKNFVIGLATGILGFIRDAILMPLAKLAQGTRGWDLLIAVMGKNPITGEPVPRNADTLIGGFMKLIGEEETWNNLKKSNALPRAWAWFQSALGTLIGFVSQIPTLFKNALKSIELIDLVIITNVFTKVAGVFGNFVGDFIKWAGDALWQLLQIIFEVLAPAAIPYLKKVGAAFKKILKDPMSFVGNLVAAGKLGFQQFADNIGTHLKNSFIEWLTGNLPSVYIPKALEFREIVKFVLSVLGLTWQNIRQKLVKVVGETAVKAMETGFDIVVTLVTEGPAAAWEKIKEQLSNLKDTVLQGITDFIVETVVKKAVQKVVSLLIPGGAFIDAIISIYNTVKVFLEKLQKIIQVVTAFLDSMMEIAAGAIGGAAKKVETTLAGLLTLAISFLAGFLGLGGIAEKVLDIINTKVRQPIDKALDKVIDWIVTTAKKLFAKVFGKKEEKEDTRTPEERERDVKSALIEGTELLRSHPNPVEPLGRIKTKYRLKVLEIRRDPPEQDAAVEHLYGEASPGQEGEKVKVVNTLPLVTITFSYNEANKNLNRKEYQEQLDGQAAGLNKMIYKDWRERRNAYLVRLAKTGSGRDPLGDAAQQALRDKVRLSMTLARIADFKKQGMSQDSAEKKATEEVDLYLKGVAALHNPDQVAGGDAEELLEIGSRSVNSSIGRAWGPGGKAEELDKGIESAFASSSIPQDQKLQAKLYVVLTL
jgi:hypothetical protein